LILGDANTDGYAYWIAPDNIIFNLL